MKPHAVNLQRAARWNLPAERILCPLPDGTKDIRLDLPEHRYAIAAWMHDPDVRFAVIDSLRGLHRGDENSSGSIDAVMWLASLARDSGKPILLTHHLRKRSSRSDPQVTLDRLRGSSAIPQACRLVWSIDAPDPWCTELRRLAVIKSNLGPFAPPLGFQIEDTGVHFGPPPSMPSQESAEDRACALLLILLAQTPMSARRLQQEGERAGISWTTMKRAKKRLHVVAIKDGATGRWYWGFPLQEDQVGPL